LADLFGAKVGGIADFEAMWLLRKRGPHFAVASQFSAAVTLSLYLLRRLSPHPAFCWAGPGAGIAQGHVDIELNLIAFCELIAPKLEANPSAERRSRASQFGILAGNPNTLGSFS
jgi:hypothetical protein